MAYGVLNNYIHGWGNYNPLLYPSWITWFLFCLFFWNILLIVFGKSKLLIPLAILLTCTIVVLDETGEYLLGLNRTFFFFPFFLLGFYTERKHIDLIKNKIGKLIGILSIITIFLITKKLQWFNPSYLWFYGNLSNDYLQVSNFKYLANIMGVHILMLMMMLAVLSFIPQKKMVFSYIGKYTIYVYLLHGFLIKIILWKGFFVYEQTLGTIIYFEFLHLHYVYYYRAISLEK